MKCTSCGAELNPGTLFCTSCGAKVTAPAEAAPAPAPVQTPAPAPAPAPAPVQPIAPAPAPVQQTYYNPPPVQPPMGTPAQPIYAQMMPDTTPLTPIQYVLYMILFCVPLVNIICMFVFAFGSGNVNRKNFARAYLIMMLIAIVLTIIGSILIAVLGAGFMAALSNAIESGSF